MSKSENSVLKTKKYWMLKKAWVKEFVVITLLAIVIGGASLIGLDSNNTLIGSLALKFRYVLVFSCLLVLLLISSFMGWSIARRFLPVLLIWFLFALAVFISSMVNSDEKSFTSGIWFLFIVPLVFFVAIPNLIGRNAVLILALAVLVGNMPYILVSLVLSPVSVPYKGIFANPNQMGVVAATLSSALFILLNAALCARKSNWCILATSLLLIGAFVLVLLSCSHTSLIAFIAMLLIFLGNWVVIKKNLKVLFKNALLITLPIIFVVIMFENVYHFVVGGIIEKINRKVESTSLLSGREKLWEYVIDDMSFWGHGSDYFDNFEIGAHNSIISILGENGIIAAVLIVCFAMFTIIYAFFYAKNKVAQDYYAIGPLIILVCFWTISMGEDLFGMLGKGITVVHMITVGIVLLNPINSAFSCERLKLTCEKK